MSHYRQFHLIIISVARTIKNINALHDETLNR